MEEKIRNVLIERCNYSEVEARETSKDICGFTSEDLRNAVRTWIHKGEITEVREGKFSTQGLMKNHSMEYPAALVFIDWYRSSSTEAESALHWMV